MKRCDQVNAFLSTFGSYTPKQKSRMAYEVKEADCLTFLGATREIATLNTAKGSIVFLMTPTSVVNVGDFIEIIKWPAVAVHWPRSQFLAQNVQQEDTVIERGDVVLEQYPGTDSLNCAGTVIMVGDRYFIEIKNGRVATSYQINAATRFGRLIDSDKKRNKALEELTARKKKPKILEVGFWSREIKEVQGGAA